MTVINRTLIVINRTLVPKGTTLKDVIHMLSITHPRLEPPYAIQYRVKVSDMIIEDAMFGYCKWDGYELTSLDGVKYSLDDEIDSYELFENLNGNSILAIVLAKGDGDICK